jgi:hypothetical protein
MDTTGILGETNDLLPGEGVIVGLLTETTGTLRREGDLLPGNEAAVGRLA